MTPTNIPAPLSTRVSRLLGIDYPIIQAPMGWIARSPLASAVSNAGGLGIIETSSGELDSIRTEIRRMRELTDKPFGVNVAQLFVRDPSIVDFVVEQGVRFVTTSAGDPRQYTSQLKQAGLTVFHVVPTLSAALKAVDAGVDGLVVEGGEGGGFKNPRDVSTMVLVPLIASKVDVPIVAAGGICDGVSMAAALALGADAVQMGTRMVSAAESPVHHNWKDAIVNGAETDTVFLNRLSRPGLRALRTERTTRLEREESVSLTEMAAVRDLYFGGDMEASIALTGQVMGSAGNLWSFTAPTDPADYYRNEYGERVARDASTVKREIPFVDTAYKNGNYLLYDAGAELRLSASLFSQSQWNSFLRVVYGFNTVKGYGDVNGDDVQDTTNNAIGDELSNEVEEPGVRVYLGLGTG